MYDDVVEVQKTHLPRKILSTCSISRSNVAGALQSPKGITVNWPHSCGECCLRFILYIEVDLSVTTCKIERAKTTRTRQGINGIVYAWKRIGVLHSSSIEHSVMYTETDLRTKTIGDAHGLDEGSMTPRFRMFSISTLASTC